MRPEVLLLDCGGTLSWPPFARTNEILRDLQGREVPLEACYRGFYRSGHALEMYLREHKRYPTSDNLTLNHWVYEQGLELEGYPGLWTMDCTMELLRREGRMGNWDTTYPWVADALARFKAAGYRMGIVSNSDGHVAELLTGLGYADYFETIVDSYIEQVWKPDPRIFYLALERMGLNAMAQQAQRAAQGADERPPVMYVGDNYRADLDGARQAGLHGMLIDPLGLFEDVPDHECTDDMASLADALCVDPS
jgi:FMN phosphatase YigB (HAD superfamily)